MATAKTELQTFSLNPTTLQEAIQFADIIAKSDMVPKDYKGKPGNVLVAVQMGAEIGLPAMQSLQNIAVINGKPGVYGDLGKAILLNKGFVIEEDDIKDIKKKGEAACTITRPGGKPVTRTYSVDNAKTAKLWGREGPWTTNPERQMQWRAFWFCARDTAADVLKGLSGAEELMDSTEGVIIDNETGQTVGAAGLSEKLKNSPKPAPKPDPAKPAAQAETVVEPEPSEKEPNPAPEDKAWANSTKPDEQQQAETTGAAEPKKAANPINERKIKVIQAALKKNNMTEEAFFQKMGISGYAEIDDSQINPALNVANGK